jgi:hypothetical protein
MMFAVRVLVGMVMFFRSGFAMVFGIGMRGRFPVRGFIRRFTGIGAYAQINTGCYQHYNRRHAGRDGFAFAQIDFHIGCCIS